MRELLTRLIRRDAGIEVVGAASNGQEALALMEKLKPDLITMDLVMPVMDGRETTRQIMARWPTPILVISAFDRAKDGNSVFRLIEDGAVDVLDKGMFEHQPDFDAAAKELIRRIKLLSGIKVSLHPLTPRKEMTPSIKALPIEVVAMTASTGGPAALNTLLRSLPKDFPCSILIVQHIAAGFTEGFARWLGDECGFPVLLARDGMCACSSTVYVAPHGSHMTVMSGGILQLTDGPAFEGNRPSGNVLFKSVAEAYGSRAIGVILTGMGTDGALGLRNIKEAMGIVIAQDERTCSVFGMSKAAIDLGVADWVLPIQSIGPQLLRLVNRARQA